MTGSFRAMDLFTTGSPGYAEVSPTWNPPGGPESVNTRDESEHSDLHRYTVRKVSVLSIGIAQHLPQEQGALFLLECWLDVQHWRKGLCMKEVKYAGFLWYCHSLQSSDMFPRVGNWKGISFGTLTSCWGHALPKVFASRIPLNDKGGCGSPKRRSPVLLTGYVNTDKE